MCDPVTLAVTATVVTMAGQGFSAMQQASQHRYQARVAERNVQLANEAGQQEQENTRQAALAHYRQVAQLKGQQRAAMAANGIDINFGSAADVQGDTDMLAREDAQRIYTQGERAVRGRDFEASNFGGEAKAQRSAATGALISGAFDMAGTALGTASQFGKVKSKTKTSSIANPGTVGTFGNRTYGGTLR